MITEKEMSLEQMKAHERKGYRCKECNSTLTVAWGGSSGINGYILRCSKDIAHTGVAREAQLSSLDTPDGLNIGNMSRIRREKLVTQIGEQKATALAKYAGAGALTQLQAAEIVTTIWPGAPEVEVKKAAMVCAQYGLNPLMKHLYLIPFNTKKGDKWEVNYSMVLGIKASRIIARRRGGYAYLDDTPRIMSTAEQEKIFGEVDQLNICAITRLQDRKGNSAIGTGRWPKATPVKGGDKGNSALNMAMIRSERQALERLFPDSLPSEAPDVVDERYQDLDDGRRVEVSTGEITEQPVEKLEAEEAVFTEQLPDSDAEFDKLESNAKQEPPSVAKPKRDPSTIKNVADLYNAVMADYPGKFKTKLDILKTICKTETDVVSPSEEYLVITEKMNSIK